MIRIDAVWLAIESLDLRVGLGLAPARVVAIFGAAQSHHACLFTNRRVLGGHGPFAGVRADFSGASAELTLKGPNARTVRRATRR